VLVVSKDVDIIFLNHAIKIWLIVLVLVVSKDVDIIFLNHAMRHRVMETRCKGLEEIRKTV